MNGFQKFILILVVCALISVAIAFVTGIQVSVRGIVFFSIGLAALVAWILQGIQKGVNDVVHPEQNKSASEVDLFGSLVDLASEKGGEFQMVGRTARATFTENGNEYVVAGRTTSQKEQFVVSSVLRDADFRIEMSAKVIPRKDCVEVSTGNAAFDSVFHLAANDAARAKKAVAGVTETLAGFGAATTMSCSHGVLELKRNVGAIDKQNTAATLEVFETILSRLNESN